MSAQESVRYTGDLSGMTVDVYKNTQKDIFSVRCQEGQFKGIVIDQQEQISLQDVTFVVDQEKRREVIKTGEKNIHAVVRGTVTAISESVYEETDSGLMCVDSDGPTVEEIHYNPYENSGFVTVGDGNQVQRAKYVLLTTDGVYAVDPT